MFETLETRRLLSSVATFSDGMKVTSGGGSLNVNNAENVSIVEHGRSGTLGDGVFEVIDPNTQQSVQVSGITNQVHVSSGGFGSQVTVRTYTVSSHVSGGGGNDDIHVADFSAAGGDQIEAGGGNDLIEIVASHNSTADGGGGDDVFNINTGAINHATMFDYDGATIVLSGGGGNDIFNIFDGSAKINGGGGTDTLNLYGDSTATYTNIEMVNYYPAA